MYSINNICLIFSTSVESSSPECMYVCLSHFFASVGAHSRLASLSKIWVCGFLWYFRKISGVVFFIFSKFSFFGLFGGLKNLKNGQKFFFGKFFFLLRIVQFAKKNHVLSNFRDFAFYLPLSNPSDTESWRAIEKGLL